MQALDLILTALLAVGLIQMAWFSMMLHKRGIPSQALQLAIPPLLSIWVLFWPMYRQTLYVLAGLGLLALILVAALLLPRLEQLHRAWSDANLGPWPLLMLISALAVAGCFLPYLPEFAFGIALSLCLAVAAADMLDWKGGRLPLGCPANPAQTLEGHLLLIAATAGLCAWSLHVYHGINFSGVWLALAATAISASLTRALIPAPWNLPCMALVMGGMLCLL